MVYVLQKVAAGSENKCFRQLEIHTRRNDGLSYISNNWQRMKGPKEISKGWYFEGCTSLPQKQGILQNLTKLGMSPTFVACSAAVPSLLASRLLINRKMSP
jgi:hypothetical protein